MRLQRLVEIPFFVSLAVLGLQAPARAEIVYVTTLEHNTIESVNTSTNTASLVANANSPDSMLFLNSNTVLYTNYNGGQLESLNLTTGVSTPLVSGFANPVDILLDPSGKTLLVTEQPGFIDRVNLSNNTFTRLVTGIGPNAGGLAYDSNGNLYAVLSNATISQVNPTTGQILVNNNFVNLSGGLDGLTFDSFTGKLYATAQQGNEIYVLNPSNLASASVLVSGVIGPDGITSDGQGNLFIAAEHGGTLDQYNLVTNTLTVSASVPGIDDPAPASGLGSPPPPPQPSSVPEPSSGVTWSLALAALLAFAWRRRAGHARCRMVVGQ
jgi:streptogramin lyase